MRHHGAPPHRFGERGVIVLAGGAHDQGVVRRLGGADMTGKLELPSLSQQLGGIDPRLGWGPSVAGGTAWMHAES